MSDLPPPGTHPEQPRPPAWQQPPPQPAPPQTGWQQPPPPQAGWHQPPPQPGWHQPGWHQPAPTPSPRATQAFAFGLVSILSVPGTIVVSIFGPVLAIGFGIAAIVLGTKEVRAIDQGLSPAIGRSKAKTGQILGIIGAVLGVAVVVFVVAVFAFFISVFSNIESLQEFETSAVIGYSHSMVPGGFDVMS